MTYIPNGVNITEVMDLSEIKVKLPKLLKKSIQIDAINCDTTMNNRIVTILGEHYV